MMILMQCGIRRWRQLKNYEKACNGVEKKWGFSAILWALNKEF